MLGVLLRGPPCFVLQSCPAGSEIGQLAIELLLIETSPLRSTMSNVRKYDWRVRVLATGTIRRTSYPVLHLVGKSTFAGRFVFSEGRTCCRRVPREFEVIQPLLQKPL